MPAADLQTQQITERERIEMWRTDALERAGYDPDAAVELATRHDVDLHLAIGLLENGCQADTALRILL